MNRKHSLQIAVAVASFGAFAVFGSNCIGGGEGSGEPVSHTEGVEGSVAASEELVQVAQEKVSTCITIQRGVSGNIYDSQVASNPDRVAKNYGAGLAMIAGQVGAGQRRALLKADLSGIPAGSTIDSATLTLQARAESNGGVGNQLSVHAITSAWSEASVTWNTAPSYDPAVAASDAGGAGAHSFDVTALAAGWMTGANEGVLLEQSGFYNTNFHTSEDVANRPALQVCYTEPVASCGNPSGGALVFSNGVASENYCYAAGDSVDTRARKACESHFGVGECCVIPDGYNQAQWGDCDLYGYAGSIHWHPDSHPAGHCPPYYVVGDVVSIGWCGSIIGRFLP